MAINPRRVLFLSSEGNGLDLAYRLQREGCSIKAYIEDKSCKGNFDGILDKTDNWKSLIPWSDLIVVDDNGLNKDFGVLFASNKPIFGIAKAKKYLTIGKDRFPAHQLSEKLEHDRHMAQEIMRYYKMGLPIESLEFSDVKQAIEHLKSHKTTHVVKSETSTSDSAMTYVGELDSNEDVIGWLEALPKRPEGGKVKKIELEERIKGVEVGIQGWFTGGKFLNSININFEHKRIATGELGFNTGEMGTAMYQDSRPNEEVKLFTETLERITPLLVSADYRGQIDINCIVNEDGIYCLEFTPRLGYPAIYIEQELEAMPMYDLLYSIALGKPIENEIYNQWAVGALLVGEGFPFWDEGRKRMSNMPIIGVTKDNIDHIHFYDAAFKEGKLVSTGSYPLTATSKGDTLSEAQDKLYKEIIPKVFFPSVYYRTDIGDKVHEYVEYLRDWGYEIG